ncbi:alpha/beta hydrolase [Algoriphagus halophilus]|uniref:alpha/beta hydrolase n=1 Tax=Algoriphagus halophilus TaxID=226505 RepID=UPI00358E2E1C
MKKIRSILILASLLLFNACEQFELETNTDTFFHVKVDDASLPVWIKGNTASSKLVIYINGGPGLTSIDVARADLFNWEEGFEENFAMVYYDQRGCGNAQGNLDERLLTIQQYVKDLDAIISVLNSKYQNPEIFLMGHSFGAFIGVNYLLSPKFQDKIRGWISIDGAYNFDYDLSWQYRRTFLINIANEEIQKGNRIDHWTSALQWTDNNQIITTREQKNEWREFVGWPGEIIIPEELATLSVRQYLQIGFFQAITHFHLIYPPILKSSMTD